VTVFEGRLKCTCLGGGVLTVFEGRLKCTCLQQKTQT
jgi:hypothetical protein